MAKLKLAISLPRTCGETDELAPPFSRQWRDAWKFLLANLSKRSFRFLEKDYVVKGNFKKSWKAVSEFIDFWEKSLHERSEIVKQNHGKYFDYVFKNTPSKLNLVISIKGRSQIDRNQIYLFLTFADRFLYDIFTFMNLLSPGSCSFVNAHVESNQSDVYLDLSALSLDSTELVWCRDECRHKYDWDPYYYIDPDKAFRWFSRIAFNVNQLADNNTQKALYSLLHICRYPSLSAIPTFTTWIAHALEALYEIPIGGAQRLLIERIFQFVDCPEKIKGRLKKEVKAFYDMRSKFVHGGLRIIHPQACDIFDDRIEEARVDIWESFPVTLSLLVSTLRKMMDLNICSLHFKESIVPIYFES